MFNTLFVREWRLTLRKKSELLNPLSFFLVVTSLFPFGVSPDPVVLSQMAPGIIWVCALLAVLLSIDVLYREDYDDGSLEQLVVSGASPVLIVVVKALVNWIFTAIPLIAISPIIAVLLHLDSHAFEAMILSLIIGTPSLCLIAAVGMALTIGLKKGGVLLALLVLPLYIPVLIFGALTVNAASMSIDYSAFLMILSAILLVTVSLAPWAAGAAIRVSIGE